MSEIRQKRKSADFDKIDELSNDQTKKFFHESSSEMGPMTSCVFFVSFFFFLFSHKSSLVWEGKERSHEKKLEY